MDKQFFIFILFFIVSCSERNSNSSDSREVISSSGLSQELYSTLIKYQKKYPLPKDLKSGLYVYEAIFAKQLKDTVLTIRRSSEGFDINDNEIVMGVYRDNNLLPTVIVDSKLLYSKNLVDKIINDSTELKKYTTKSKTAYPESFPPVYRYKLQGRDIILDKIDTVWLRWRQ